MRIHAAQPERADAAMPRPAIRGQRLKRAGHPHRSRVKIDMGIRRCKVRLRGHKALAESQHGLGKTGSTGGRIQMAYVALHRADQCLGFRSHSGADKGCCKPFHLHGVAKHGGRAVRLEKAHGRKRNTGIAGRKGDHLCLCIGVGGCHAGRAAILIDGTARDDGMNGIVVAHGRIEQLEHEHCRAFTRSHAVCRSIKGSCPAGSSLDGEGRVALHRQINGVHPARKRNAAFSRTQALTGIVHSLEHRRAGRIHRGRRPAPVLEIAQPRHHVGRHVQQIYLLGLVGECSGDGILKKPVGAGTHKGTHVPVFKGCAAIARIIEGLRSHFQKEALLRVQHACIAGRKAETPVVERRNICKIRRLAQLCRIKGIAHGLENLAHFPLPPFRQGNVLVYPACKVFPEALGVFVVSHAHSHADDGHRGMVVRQRRGRSNLTYTNLFDTVLLGTARLNPLCLLSDGTVRKEARERKHTRPAFFQQGMQLHQQQGIAPRLEESQLRVGYRHFRHHAVPETANGIAQRTFIRLRKISRRLQQSALHGLSIGLARGAERNDIRKAEQRRLHVFRQHGRKLGAQLSERQRCTRMGQHKGFQSVVSAHTADAHNGLRHAGAAVQGSFHLTKFDAETANLDLIVVSAEVFDIAVRKPPAKVARAVHTAAGEERIGQKAAFRQVRPVHVASGHLNAAYIQLSGHTGGDRPPLRIKHIQAGVAHGPADGNGAGNAAGAGVPRYVYGRFRGAVQVMQLRLQQGFPPFCKVCGQCLTAGKDVAQARKPADLFRIGLKIIQKYPKHGGHKMQHRNAVCGNGGNNFRGVLFPFRFQQGKLRTAPRPPEQLPYGDIERNGRLLQNDIALPDGEARLHPQQAVAQAAVLYLHALGSSGGAGGEQRVGHGIRSNILRGAFRCGQGCHIRHQHLLTAAFKPV